MSKVTEPRYVPVISPVHSTLAIKERQQKQQNNQHQNNNPDTQDDDEKPKGTVVNEYV